MIYEDVLKNFAERTKHNLKLIEDQKYCGEEAYEVTQLINSCLGLLVFPQQEFFKSIPETPIDELEKEGWVIPKVRGHFPQVENLKQLIRYLRNAISHFNIEFLGDSENEISTIKVWNVNDRLRPPKKTWEAELGLDELKAILNNFSDLILKGINN